MRYLLILFVAVPLGELYLLLWLSRLIGFWPTVAIALVTGMVGAALAKREGLRVWRAWSRALDELRSPEQGVIDGLLVLVGGVLLITPGIVTDAVGFLLLFPTTRRPLVARVRRAVDRRIADGSLRITGNFYGAAHPEPPERGRVIETTGESVDDAARGHRIE